MQDAFFTGCIVLTGKGGCRSPPSQQKGYQIYHDSKTATTALGLAFTVNKKILSVAQYCDREILLQIGERIKFTTVVE